MILNKVGKPLLKLHLYLGREGCLEYRTHVVVRRAPIRGPPKGPKIMYVSSTYILSHSPASNILSHLEL